MPCLPHLLGAGAYPVIPQTHWPAGISDPCWAPIRPDGDHSCLEAQPEGLEVQDPPFLVLEPSPVWTFVPREAWAAEVELSSGVGL